MPKTNTGFYADEKKIKQDGRPQDGSHLLVVGSYLMMMVMMFVTHIVSVLIGMNATQKQVHTEISDQYAQEGKDAVNVVKHWFLEGLPKLFV